MKVPLNQSKKRMDVERLPWAWHPDRSSPVKAPADFVEQLHAIDAGLEVTWSPVHERWLIWQRSPSSKNTVCPGWKLIFLWEHARTHAYLPLSDLVFHNLYMRDRNQYSSGAEYFAKIQQRIEAARLSRDREFTDERQTRQLEMTASHKISSAGNGSRSALFDQGTMIPSRGEANWKRETRKWRMPGELIQAEKDQKEKAFYGK